MIRLKTKNLEEQMEPRLELEEAIETGNLEEFRRLFDVSDFDCDEYSSGGILHTAVKNGAAEFVKFLVRKGADVNREAGYLIKTLPVIVAAKKGDLEIVRYLLESAGASFDVSRISKNPLFEAASRGSTDVVEYLIGQGIDPHLTYRTRSGALINAYSEANERKHADVVQLLKKHGCRIPVEGQDVPVREPSQGNLLNHTYGVRDIQTPSYQKYLEIIGYMEDRFGVADQDGMQQRVQVIEEMSVSIHVISPNDKHPYYVLFTNGMSDLPMKVPESLERWQYAELVMYLPPEWINPREAGADLRWLWPVKWLRTMAYQPHLNDSWLGLPAAIVSSQEPPMPLGPNTKQSCLVVLPDVLKLKSPLQTSEGRQIHFFTMVPIYTEERDIELQHGMDEFFDRFLNNEVSLTVDLNRPNFAMS